MCGRLTTSTEDDVLDLARAWRISRWVAEAGRNCSWSPGMAQGEVEGGGEHTARFRWDSGGLRLLHVGR